MVCPFGCVCHAVRAPGVKWTLLPLTRETSDGAATASMKTVPVNHSSGPAAVSRFLVISMVSNSFLHEIASALVAVAPASLIDVHTLTDGGQSSLDIARRIADFVNDARETLELALYDIRLHDDTADV